MTATFDRLSRAIRRAPHSYYRALNHPPVQPVPGHPNFWTVAGHSTVTEVLRNPWLYDGQPFPDHEVPVMSAMAPDQHKRVRAALQGLFTRRALDQLDEFITEQAVRRTTALARAGCGDLMALWANPIPLSVIATLFGFPSSESDLARLHRYGDAAVRLVIPYGGPGLPVPRGPRDRFRQLAGLAAAAPAASRLARRLPKHDRTRLLRIPNPLADRPGYPRTGLSQHPQLARLIMEFNLEVLDIFTARLQTGGDNVVDALVGPYRRGELSLVEILTSALQILVAGYETTASVLGSAVHRIAADPQLLDALRDDQDVLTAFVEETLRLDAPLQRTLRRTTAAAVLAGVPLPADAQLIVMLGAANVDEDRYQRPELFDPERPDVHRHLAFGTGIHTCIGATLARMEARIALRVFAEQFKTVSLIADAPPIRLDDKDIGMWSFSALPVRVETRTPAGVTR